MRMVEVLAMMILECSRRTCDVRRVWDRGVKPTGPGCCPCGSRCWNVTTKRINARGIDVDAFLDVSIANPVEMLIVAAATRYLHLQANWSTKDPVTLCAAYVVNRTMGGP